MSSDPVALVEQTWAIASGIDGVIDTFYGRLFTIRPEFKTTLFGRTNMKAQGKMLASMLDTAVKNLRNPDVLVPALQELGMRHCRYGCRPEHYPPVGEALLWTLEFYFKEKFTAEVKAAWVQVYTTVQTVMTSQCQTEEGKRLLKEYEDKYGVVPAHSSSSCDSCCTVKVIVAVAAIGLAVFLFTRNNKK